MEVTEMVQRMWGLFWTFFKVGILAYGGGPSMIPLMEQEVVQSQRWMSIPEFTDVLALGNALPGPIATKMALAVGYKIDGMTGGLVALFGLLLPSSILMLAVILFFLALKDSPRMHSVLRGVRPAVMALLFITAYDVGKDSVVSVPTAIIGIVTFFVFLLTKLHPAIALLISGVVGLLFL
jgi:chromate transporter